MELNIKHLSPYLPYKLSIIDFKSKEPYPMEMEGFDTHLNKIIAERMNWEYNEVKPVLRNLSDLTKEIGHNGKKVTPYEYISTSKKDSQENMRRIGNGNVDMLAWWKIERLLQLHFDVFGLIKAGCAIEQAFEIRNQQLTRQLDKQSTNNNV